jgi:hypothetical protein
MIWLMSAVNKSVSMLYDLPTSRSSLLAICQQWAYNLSLKFSNMEIYGSRFFTDRIHMAHRFASFATESHDLSQFNLPEPLPRCAFQTLAVADPPLLRALSRLFMRRNVREPLSPQQTAQVAVAFSGLQVAIGGGKGMKHGRYF